MILYLSRNESANLLDRAASEKSLHIRKKTGNFNLSEFIINDMRKYASCRFFCVERVAITENDAEFIEALQSFQMMFSARIIVIHESIAGIDSLTQGLVQIGVTNIVTDSDMDDMLDQIDECLSYGGMQRHKPKTNAERDYIVYEDDDSYDEQPHREKGTLAQNIIRNETEDEHYRFDCINVNIGIIGATRRVGTTTVALGLANFIKNHGGTACYVAFNMNRHLESITKVYGFDTEDDYYTHDAIDYYEVMKPQYNYNFIITDFGDLYYGGIRREAVKGFKECDVHLLCGASCKRFEVEEFSEALKSVKSVKLTILTHIPNPEVREFFGSTVTDNPTIIKPVKSMLDFKTNGMLLRSILSRCLKTCKKISRSQMPRLMMDFSHSGYILQLRCKNHEIICGFVLKLPDS